MQQLQGKAMAFAPLLAEKWIGELYDKPTAHGTVFRNSGAGKCARQLVFSAMARQGHAGLVAFEMDEAGAWVTRLGTEIHEKWQEALAEAWPGSLIEMKVGSPHDVTSGHLDALVTTSGGAKICLELKTCNGTKFRRIVGAANGRYSNDPEGPGADHRLQLALNIVGSDADFGRIVYLAMEAIARGKGFGGFDRFCSEWEMSRDVADTLAARELHRLQAAADELEAGKIPAPVHMIVRNGQVQEELITNADRRVFPCGYCPNQAVCVGVGL